MTQSEFEQTFKSEMVRRMSESRVNLSQTGYYSLSDEEETTAGSTLNQCSGFENTTTHAEVILPSVINNNLSQQNNKLYYLEASA